MDKQRAKQLLTVMRPNGQDHALPEFADALALVQSDPELKTWWETQLAFDQKVAAKLEAVSIPKHLRSTILAGQKIKPFPAQPRLSYWLAAAALVAILCVAGTFRHVAASGPLDSNDYTAKVLPLLNHNAPALAMATPDHEKIAAWLKEQNAPMGTLPEKMATLPTVGCQKFAVHGHTVSLICFTMPNGGLAHLFIVDKAALNDPPGCQKPEFRQTDEWTTAAWSDGRMSYVLATESGADALKQIL